MTTSVLSLMLSSQNLLSTQPKSSNKQIIENNILLSKDNNEPERKQRFSYFYLKIQQYFNLSNFFQNKEQNLSNLPEFCNFDEDQDSYFTSRTNFSSSVYSSISKSINSQELENKLIAEKKKLNEQSSLPKDFTKTHLPNNNNLNSKDVASTSNSNFFVNSKDNKFKKLTKNSNQVLFFFNFSRKQSSVSNNDCLNTEKQENDLRNSTELNFNNQNFVNKKKIMPLNVKSGISKFDQEFQTASTSSLNSINSIKGNLLLNQDANITNVALSSVKYAFGGDTFLPAGTSPLALEKKSFFSSNQPLFSNSKLLNKSSQNFNVTSENKDQSAKESSSSLKLSKSRLALNVLNASTTAMIPTIGPIIGNQSTAINNVHQNSNSSSIVSTLINNGSVGNTQTGFQQQVLKSIKLQGGFEPHHLEPLQRYKPLLNLYFERNNYFCCY